MAIYKTWAQKNGPQNIPGTANAAAAAGEIGDSIRRDQRRSQPPRVCMFALTFEELRYDHPGEHIGVFNHERLSGLCPAGQITRLVRIARADHLKSLAQKYGLLLVLRHAPPGLRAHGVVAACGHANPSAALLERVVNSSTWR